MHRSSCCRLRSSTSPKVLIVLIVPPLILSRKDTGRTRTAVDACCRRVPRLSATVSWRRTEPAPGRSLALQLLELVLTPVVLVELLDDAAAEDAQRCDQRVQLVQRVGPAGLRIDVELELDPVRAVGDLEDHPRLEVVRLVVGAAVAVVLLETAARRVLHVRDDERAAVEAGQVQEPTLVHAGSIRDAHRMTSFRSLGFLRASERIRTSASPGSKPGALSAELRRQGGGFPPRSAAALPEVVGCPLVAAAAIYQPQE